MHDREKVINGLELLAHWPDALIITDKEKWIKPCCEMAVALLKEQEPKAAIITHQNEYCKDGNCPSCGHELDDNMHPKYCGYCGQAVEWNV